MVIKLPRSRESTPVAVTPPSTTLGAGGPAVCVSRCPVSRVRRSVPDRFAPRSAPDRARSAEDAREVCPPPRTRRGRAVLLHASPVGAVRSISPLSRKTAAQRDGTLHAPPKLLTPMYNG